MGAWYNHWAKTKATVLANDVMLVNNVTKDGPSSHNHMFDVPVKALVVTELHGTSSPMFKKDLYGDAQFISDADDLKPYVFIGHFHSSVTQPY